MTEECCTVTVLVSETLNFASPPPTRGHLSLNALNESEMADLAVSCQQQIIFSNSPRVMRGGRKWASRKEVRKVENVLLVRWKAYAAVSVKPPKNTNERVYKCRRRQRRSFLVPACVSSSQQRALWHWQTAALRGNRRLWTFEKLKNSSWL